MADESDTLAYNAFRAKHRRSDEFSSADYRQRFALFVQRRAQVKAHNANPGATWRAEINKFSDFDEEEFQLMLGYRRAMQRSVPSASASTPKSASFLQMQPGRVIAESKDWRLGLNSSSYVREQGGCGSCWAVAAVGALEMHRELATGRPSPKLSFKHLVDCVPNPKNCGGSGGCKGATAELAFRYVRDHGIALETSYGDSDIQGNCPSTEMPLFQSRGFVALPANKLDPLLEVVHHKGPVVVSVDASGWATYANGVFDGCERDATVNHAVLLVGYGHTSEQKKYWSIRNSWGHDWGEHGYIRLQRHDTDEGKEGYCGTDRDPKAGVGCDDGPTTLPVCGMCGVLSDSSYPDV